MPVQWDVTLDFKELELLNRDAIKAENNSILIVATGQTMNPIIKELQMMTGHFEKRHGHYLNVLQRLSFNQIRLYW